MSEDEFFVFEEESKGSDSHEALLISCLTRKVLIVDDDKDVHITTELSLKGQLFDNYSLIYLHAYNAEEAYNLLLSNNDIAVIILDVVMESEHAGLGLVHQIRDGLQLLNVRIILRTGQPGYAPELETILKYDINDYKTKSELTQQKLCTTILASLRCYNQLIRLEQNREGLEKIIESTNDLMLKKGFRDFAEGIIIQLASVLGLYPDGLVCFSKVNQGYNHKSVSLPSFEVVASAGRYSEWMIRTPEFESQEIVDLVKNCFIGKKNTFEESYTCIYFEPEIDCSYVIYFDSAVSDFEDELQLVKIFTHNISMCAKNLNLIEKLNDIAYKDSLTGLINRNGLIRYIEKESERLSVLLLIDLDQFSMLNDNLGSSYGDDLLKIIANRCERNTHVKISARLWSDQFALVIEPNACVKDVISDLSELVNISGVERVISMCSGVSYRNDDLTAEELVANATIALKRAKKKGLGQTEYFDSRMVDELRNRSLLLADLKKSINKEFLSIVYQPQIDLKTSKVIGVEALCRWINNNNFVPPDVFIPLAEQSGLIFSLGEFVLNRALSDLHSLHKINPDLIMAVNVSTLQFKDQNFENIIRNVLINNNTSGCFLDLEITESVGILGSHEVEGKIKRLKEMGVMVSIDDFGTGFSSLSYLDRLSADKLKIDKSFVDRISRDYDGVNITDMIVALGRRLNLKVLAEGIETNEQFNFLRDIKCHEGQGYLFSKPLSIDDLLVWLENNK